MATDNRQPERDRTNSSLRAERRHTDDELARNGGLAEERADDVVDRARDQADTTLGAARAKSDAKMEAAGASVEAVATAKAQREDEDSALETEHRTADFLLEGEREQRERAIAGLLEADRAQTDKHLLLERALFDERVARILAELAEALRIRDEFIAVASHELRTPLTPLALRLQSLARVVARQPESQFAHEVNRYIDTAKRQVKRLTALVADLLDVSRIASGKLTLELEPVDFGAVVRDVAGRHRSQAEAAGSSLEIDAPEIMGRWDELLLDQTVTNLLENAIQYGLGKPIRVRLEATSDTARLTVQDEGIGIAPDDFSRIFGRFERAVPGRSYGGLGLGLYTCRAIVEAMDGSVAVQSELGRGSKFTVELPLSGPVV